MRNEFKSRGCTIRRFAVVLVVLGTLGIGSMLSSANAPTTSVTITNNSSHEIRHIYLSSTSEENWGADQLDPSIISPGGGTFTLSVACSAADIKVIAEDVEGCFLYQVVACGQSTTWTIANDSSRNCGN